MRQHNDNDRLPYQKTTSVLTHTTKNVYKNSNVLLGFEAGVGMIATNPEEFQKFHCLLLSNAPNLYQPYYFPVEKRGKEPVGGISWKENRKSFDEAYRLMAKGYNIGIAGTDLENDYLCIVDVDDMDQVPEIKSTLQIASRKRIGRHNYFFSMEKTAKINIPTKHAGEVRAVWQYVLAPGSFVTCSEEEIARMPDDEKPYAGMYTVLDARPPTTLEFDELPPVYRARHDEMRQAEIEAALRSVQRKNTKQLTIIKYASDLWDLDISTVSGVSGTGAKVAMPSEIHGSETGHNCSVSNGLMTCWRHYVIHCAFSYLAVAAGIMSCEQAGKPHGGRSFGVDFKDGYTVFEVWKYAKKCGYIPEDDPIPHSALVYYAMSRGICEKKDLIFDSMGWRLSDLHYKITLMVSEKEGINLGRK